jgi:hypothetical protein
MILQQERQITHVQVQEISVMLILLLVEVAVIQVVAAVAVLQNLLILSKAWSYSRNMLQESSNTHGSNMVQATNGHVASGNHYIVFHLLIV